MTLCFPQTGVFFHFRPFRPATRKDVFPSCFPSVTGDWLGAESNRRHVDFQSTALPTELPSRKIDNRTPSRAFTMQDFDCRASAPLAVQFSNAGGRRLS